MARLSTIFSLSNTQAELDFVDVDVSTDTPLFIDPFAIQIRNDDWSSNCGDHIRSFFHEILQALRSNNDQRALHLLGNLHEPNETCLGVSEGAPQGRAIGPGKAAQIVAAMKASRAFATGILSDVSESELFIQGIGPDTVSDLTTNVIRGLLAEYTRQQCSLHNIPTRTVRNIGPGWNIEHLNWEATGFELPVVNRAPILFVPKFSVRIQLGLNSQEFYNHHMVEYLRQEYLVSSSSLVQVLKNGTRRVTKAAVKERHPFIKDDLAAFVRDHPEILERYKELKGAEGALDPDQLEMFFDEQAFAESLIEALRAVPPGSDSATHYHSLAAGICTFLFYPHLIYPIKEFELHEGRKRLDLKFTNTATRGFFIECLLRHKRDH